MLVEWEMGFYCEDVGKPGFIIFSVLNGETTMMGM